MIYRGFASRVVLVVCLAGTGCALGPDKTAERVTSTEISSEINGLITRYAQSVDAADTKLASEIWAISADVSFIHPLGHEHGWEAVKTNVYTKLMGEIFSERKLAVKDIVVHAYPDTAWAEFYWDFVARLRSDGTTLMTHGRETQVYRKIDGRWRLVHVHYSGMPAAGKRGGF
jgi:ketosteroid isomerase-like protein